MIPFFNKIVNVLNDANIPYMLSGSVAMGIHIIPRATRDFDFVVYMQKNKVVNFIEQFKDHYYCNEDAVRAAIDQKSMFNIIDFETHYKADFILMKEDDYGIEAFNRRNEIEYYGKNFFLITAEDLLIAKIIWIQNIQSAVQMEDIKNISQLNTIDWEYTNKWVKKLNLNTFNLF